jgi:M6 family metalloprotease-like protein
LLLASGLVFAQGGAAAGESQAAAHMRGLNNSLLNLHGQMQQADAHSTSALRSQAATVIAQRSGALVKLIQSDPRAALSFAFSPELLADLAAKFPESAGLLEAHATATGPVQHWIADYPGFKTSKSIWRMKTVSGSLDLHFAAGEPGTLRSDQALQVTGVVAGSAMAVDTSVILNTGPISSVSHSILPTQPNWQLAAWQSPLWLTFGFVFAGPRRRTIARRKAAALMQQAVVYAMVASLIALGVVPAVGQNSCTTTGVQNTLVILVNLPNGALPAAVTVPAAQDVFFANNTAGPSLDGFLREASYGKTSAAGQVIGPFNLTGTYTSCSDVGGAVLNDALAAAISSGVNLNSYSRVFLVLPDIFGCGWAGFASNSCTISSPSGSFNASVAFVAAAYITPRNQGVETVSHEMGHNLGLLHAGTITSGTDILGPVTSPGVENDMGDYWTTMGSPEMGLYPAPQKAEVLGWLTSGTNVQTVQSSGTFTLQPLESASTGLQALKVQRGTGNNASLWIEYRQPVGSYDSTLFSQPFSGALIHYEDPNVFFGHTYLPDFNPSDLTGNSPALGVGQTWTDPYSNLALSVVSANSSGLTVNVNYGAVPCTPSNPTVTVSPLNPSTLPGGSASYAMQVASNDSSGCASSTFNLTSSQPSNWGTSFSANSVTVAPGKSASVTMYKTGPATTPPGTYAVDASAGNSTYVGSGTANVTVIAAPSLSVALSAPASASLRSTVAITATVINGGVPASGANVKFSLTAPNGSVTTQSSTTGSNGVATWNYKTSSRSLAGTYTVSAQAGVTSGSRKSATTNTATSSPVAFTLQ